MPARQPSFAAGVPASPLAAAVSTFAEYRRASFDRDGSRGGDGWTPRASGAGAGWGAPAAPTPRGRVAGGASDAARLLDDMW